MRLILVVAAILATGVSTAPGDDFDAWANASWRQAVEIPAGRPRWNGRDEIADLVRRQLAALLEDATQSAPGTEARKVANFLAAQRSPADAQGLAPLMPLLARIDAVRDKTALARLLGELMLADVDPVNVGTYDSAHWLGLSVGPGTHGETANVVYLLQGGLGLDSREAYLDPAQQPRRADYLKYLSHLLELAGFDHADERAEAALRLETAIAQSHATADASADDRSADTVWTREQLTREAPGIDWTRFFDAAGLARQPSFVIWQPSAVKGGAALVGSQPLAAWLDYLRLRTLDEYAEFLPRPFADAHAAIHGAPDPDSAQKALGGLIGKLYAERYFPPAQKAHADAIVRNVTAAFRRRVAAVTWLSPAGRAMALKKLDTVYFGMGYPEHWPNYSTLLVSPIDPIGNRWRLAAWNYQAVLSRVGQPVDLASWWIAPQNPAGLLMFNQNAYNFTAALLQPPKYDPAATDAMNYGAIGAIVGHELSHFVDTLGADYDDRGRKVHWWSAADLAGYEAATAPLVRQFSNYSIPTGEHLDGRRMLVENVADLAGLSAAFDAYRLTLGQRSNDKDYVRGQDRDFFIGFARAWRSRYRDEALQKQVTTDHAPEPFRIATVRNLDAWYEAFQVTPGQKLYLDPQSRAHVW